MFINLDGYKETSNLNKNVFNNIKGEFFFKLLINCSLKKKSKSRILRNQKAERESDSYDIQRTIQSKKSANDEVCEDNRNLITAKDEKFTKVGKRV